jgi:small GTP-binding protein
MSVPADPAPSPAPRSAPLKICLVGAPGVGKTSLVQRLLHDRFPAVPASPGISVALHAVAAADGRPLPISLWDVAGSSLIDTLNQAFLSRVDALAAVIDDVRDAAGAVAAIAQVRRLYPRCAAAVLLNKCDRAEASPARPALPADIGWHEVSARDGRGLQLAIAALARAARAR